MLKSGMDSEPDAGEKELPNDGFDVHSGIMEGARVVHVVAGGVAVASIVLHHGSGASDFELVGPAWDESETRSLMFNVRRLLEIRGQRAALALLDAIPFSIFPATNHFNDEFEVLHAELPLVEYEALRLSQKEKRSAAREIAETISEVNGPYIRFVAAGLALADPETWDVFICHASEDKAMIARPLCAHLESSGIRCWLDEAQIAWGESLVEMIQNAIARARFVIVIISPSFIQKSWASKELRTALSLEVETGRSFVLPLIAGDPSVLLSSLPFVREKRYLVWQGDAALVETELRGLVCRQGRRNPQSALTDDRALRAEFDKLRRRILHVAITNEIPGALRDLRALFIDRGLVDRPSLRPFFDTWLSSPFVTIGAPVPNLLTAAQIRQMNDELRSLNF